MSASIVFGLHVLKNSGLADINILRRVRRGLCGGDRNRGGFFGNLAAADDQNREQ